MFYVNSDYLHEVLSNNKKHHALLMTYYNLAGDLSLFPISMSEIHELNLDTEQITYKEE